ncbi:MAG: hypothetical protein ACI9XC_002582 [Gammaproteobacteria bacterium]|jgi:hypothetical protein
MLLVKSKILFCHAYNVHILKIIIFCYLLLTFLWSRIWVRHNQMGINE